MIHLMLIDSELEFLPSVGDSREVFDRHLHKEEAYRAGSRRGRPDIVHAFLSLCQASIANKKGKIKTWVHTRNDMVIEAEKDAKVPPNYFDFLELVSRVLSGKKENGFSSNRETFQDLLKSIAPKKVVVLTPLGELMSIDHLLKKEEEIVIIIGGFPEGDYLSPAYEMATHRVCLGSDLLTVWTVTCEVLSSVPKSDTHD